MQTEIDGSRRYLRRLPRVGIVLLLSALGLLLAACSSGSAATTTTSGSKSSTASKSSSSSFTAYRNCLSQHGVTLPNFSHGGGGPSGTGGFHGGTPPTGAGGFRGFANNPKFATAEKACASLRPKGGFGGGFGRGGANSTAFAAYRNCMKLHGVTFPTPGTASSSPPSTADTSSAAYQAAAAACASLRPTPTSTPSSTG